MQSRSPQICRPKDAESPVTSRRAFLAWMAAGSAVLTGCGANDELLQNPGGGSTRLSARPSTPATPVDPGTYALTDNNPNDGALVVPAGVTPGVPRPLLIVLHGAGQGAVAALNFWRPYAQARGCLLLAPGARGLTWDVMSYRFSYDVTFINSALLFAFSRCAVDTTRIALEGFSDGGTYAMGLGLANGDLFTRIVGNSSGYIPRSDSPATGKSQFFLTHGRQDGILNIDRCSRAITSTLRNRGYDVTLAEFDGGHELPAAVVNQSLDWALR